MISPTTARIDIIQQSKRANVGHIGSALSIIDILWVLYEKILNLSEKENIIHDSIYSLQRARCSCFICCIAFKRIHFQRRIG